MEKIVLREEYIKLGQALKAINLVESGVEAKIVIINGEVKVNGVTEYQRGKKLRAGDIIEYNGEKVLVSES
ncbi:MAG: RNA-binding S4 domain-containing protein [Lachnospiraceae bacterium]|nr:RNA-binding S4 domain-containing protein [Lachnospiraceae bacterium]